MPKRHQFYDPFVDGKHPFRLPENPPPEQPAPVAGEPEQPLLRGLAVDTPGQYVLYDDVIVAVEAYAAAAHEAWQPVLRELAAWLRGEPAAMYTVPTADGWEGDGLDSAITEEVVRAALDEAHVVLPDGAERIEMYPDAAGKWMARLIGEDGSVLFVTSGDFDQDSSRRDATSRWPGLTVYEVASETADSKWSESGAKRPSPRMWRR